MCVRDLQAGLIIPIIFATASASSADLATSPLGTPTPYCDALDPMPHSLSPSCQCYHTDLSSRADKYSWMLRFLRCWIKLRVRGSYPDDISETFSGPANQLGSSSVHTLMALTAVPKLWRPSLNIVCPCQLTV